MEWVNALLAVLAGLFLRLAIPVAITVLAVYILHKLDKRWQEEAASVAPAAVVKKIPCWDVKNCSAEQRANCSGYTSPKPCWQTRRLPNGYLRKECLGCLVFLQAPIPLSVHS